MEGAHAAQLTPEVERRDERRLAARALAGEEEALRLIMADNNRRLYRIARSIVLDSHEAEDVVQEAYLEGLHPSRRISRRGRARHLARADHD